MSITMQCSTAERLGLLQATHQSETYQASHLITGSLWLYKEQLEHKAFRESRELPDLLEQLALRALQDRKELKVTRAIRATLVLPELKATPEIQDQRELQELLVHKGSKVFKVKLVLMGRRVTQGRQVQQAQV
jgi:hypothetical protein